MEGYFPLKMKRKEVEDVSDDFSEFSLSSPARKIRRLDAELPPIIEEEECDSTPLGFDYQNMYKSSSGGGVKIEELPDVPENEERAIVLFKPTIVHSPSSYSVSVDPHFLSGIKNQVPWSRRSSSWRLVSDEEAEEDKYSNSSDSSLAVVPWVPSQFPSAPAADNSSQIDTADMMDMEGIEEASMDVEDSMPIEQKIIDGANGVSVNEGLHQWQQQHCLIPQPPHSSTSTPIVWYR